MFFYIFIDVDWCSMDFLRCPLILVELIFILLYFHWFTWISWIVHGISLLFQRCSLNFDRFFMDCHCIELFFFWFFIDLSKIFIDLHWFFATNGKRTESEQKANGKRTRTNEVFWKWAGQGEPQQNGKWLIIRFGRVLLVGAGGAGVSMRPEQDSKLLA